MNVVEQSGTQNMQANYPPNRPWLRVGWMSDLGLARDLNEDALVAMTLDYEQGDEQQSIGLFAIADGMGGYANGEHASEGAIRCIAQALLRQLIAPAIGGSAGADSLNDVMRNAVVSAHEQVLRAYPGAGTTLKLARVLGSRLAIA